MIKRNFLPKNRTQALAEGFFLLLFGGVTYYGIEVLYRGYSHWSMGILGAVCFLEIFRIHRLFNFLPTVAKALMGSCAITALELVAGLILNLWLELRIWDYSNMPLHLWGQICLPFSVMWFFLCFPALFFCRLIEKKVFLSDA